MGHIEKVAVGLVWQKRDPLMQTDAWRKERSQKWHRGKKVSTPSGSGGNSYQVCLRDLNIFLVCMPGDRRLSQSERASLIQPQSGQNDSALVSLSIQLPSFICLLVCHLVFSTLM